MKYNLIAVYDETCVRLLLCKRRKDPFKGLYNLVGGKIEAGESGLDAAYRELQEETGVTRQDIMLTHLMDLNYAVDSYSLEVYVGRLNHPVEPAGDENELLWMPADGDFFSLEEYAGEGLLGHIVEQIRGHRDVLLA